MPQNATLNSIEVSDKGGYIVKYTTKGETRLKKSIVTQDVLESIEGLEDQLIASMHKLGELGDSKPTVRLDFVDNNKGFKAVSSISAEDPKLDEQQDKFSGKGGYSKGGGSYTPKNEASIKALAILKSLEGVIANVDITQEDLLSIARKVLAVHNQLEADIKAGTPTKEVSGSSTSAAPQVVSSVPKAEEVADVHPAVASGGDAPF